MGQTPDSPSAPRGKVVAGGSILVVVRDWQLCVETEILLWEKEGRGKHFLNLLV